MIARYRIERGRRLQDLPVQLRRGRRIDTRKHTRHFLRPTPELVAALQGAPTAEQDRAFRAFATGYLALLRQRFADDRAPFDALRDLALRAAVFLGCSCPSAANPDVRRCHTVLALQFLRQRYPELEVRLPAEAMPPER